MGEFEMGEFKLGEFELSEFESRQAELRAALLVGENQEVGPPNPWPTDQGPCCVTTQL